MKKYSLLKSSMLLLSASALLSAPMVHSVGATGGSTVGANEENGNLKVGQKFKDSNGFTYKILSLDENGQATVQFGDGNRSLKSDAAEIIIPETVNHGGVAFKVTEIASHVFTSQISEFDGLYNGPKAKKVTIPKTVTKIQENAFVNAELVETVEFAEGSQLREIGNKAFYFSHLSKISLPDSVEIIGKQAFNFNENLREVEISEHSNLKTIGDSAFRNTKELRKLYIPKHVTALGENILSSNQKLQEVEVSPENAQYTSAEGVLFSKDKSTLIIYPANKRETSYTLPPEVKNIASYAFENVADLETLEFNEGLSSIQDFALKNVQMLRHLTLPNGLEHLGRLALYNLPELETLKVPRGIKMFGSTPIYNLPKLKVIEIDDLGENFKADIIGGQLDSLEKIVLKGNAEQLNHKLIESDKVKYEVEDKTLKEKLVSLGVNEANILFVEKSDNSSNSTSEELSESSSDASEVSTSDNSESEKPTDNSSTSENTSHDETNSVTNTENSKPKENDETESLKVGQKFKDSNGFTYKILSLDENGHATVQFGDGNRSLQSEASEVIIPETVNHGGIEFKVTEIASHVFTSQISEFDGLYHGPKAKKVTIPKTVTKLQENAFVNAELVENIEFAEGSQLKEIGNKAFYFSHLTAISLPDSVETIGKQAFDFNENLKQVEISEHSNLKTIGDSAFRNTKELRKLYIPKHVTALGENILSSNQQLQEVEVSPENTQYTSEDGVLFSKDKSTLIIYPSKKRGTSYKLPPEVKNIASYAFENVEDLETLEFNEGLASIQDFALKNVQRLQHLTLPDSLEHLGRLSLYILPELETLKIPKGIKTFGKTPIYDLPKLKEVEIGDLGENFNSDIIGGQLDSLEKIVLKGNSGQLEHKLIESDKVKYEVEDQTMKEKLVSLGISEENILLTEKSDANENNKTDNTSDASQGSDTSDNSASGSTSDASQGSDTSDNSASGSTSDASQEGSDTSDNSASGSTSDASQGSESTDNSASGSTSDASQEGSDTSDNSASGSTSDASQGSESTDNSASGSTSDASQEGSGNTDNSASGSTSDASQGSDTSDNSASGSTSDAPQSKETKVLAENLENEDKPMYDLNADTDGDGYSNQMELVLGSDPNDKESLPQPQIISKNTSESSTSEVENNATTATEEQSMGAKETSETVAEVASSSTISSNKAKELPTTGEAEMSLIFGTAALLILASVGLVVMRPQENKK